MVLMHGLTNVWAQGNVGLMYVDLRSFGKAGMMSVMEIAECAPAAASCCVCTG